MSLKYKIGIGLFLRFFYMILKLYFYQQNVSK